MSLAFDGRVLISLSLSLNMFEETSKHCKQRHNLCHIFFSLADELRTLLRQVGNRAAVRERGGVWVCMSQILPTDVTRYEEFKQRDLSKCFTYFKTALLKTKTNKTRYFGVIRSEDASSKRWPRGKHSDRGFNWTTLFLGDINTGTWFSRMGSLGWESKVWFRVLRDSDHWVITL
jgi:hypothetical protein